MSQNELELYEPLNLPKSFGKGIWTVDGPIVRMAMYGTSIPFPTRMTLIRLENGDLWCHSPIEPSPELRAAVDRLGRVRHLVSPNKIHYAHIGAASIPDSVSASSRGIRIQAPEMIR